jgi:hypothetical protein
VPRPPASEVKTVTPMAAPSIPDDPQSRVVREASAFLWTVLEHGGSPTLRDAALALYPGGLAVPKAEDTLRHMLRVAVAVLCDSGSVRVIGEPAPVATESIGPTEVIRSAERVVVAIEEATWDELAEAHSYFLAPPWSRALNEQRPLLTDLALGIIRFMLDCAWQWADEHLPPPRIWNRKP